MVYKNSFHASFLLAISYPVAMPIIFICWIKKKYFLLSETERGIPLEYD